MYLYGSQATYWSLNFMQDLLLHIETVMLKQSVGLFMCTCVNFNIGRINFCVRCYYTDVRTAECLTMAGFIGPTLRFMCN